MSRLNFFNILITIKINSHDLYLQKKKGIKGAPNFRINNALCHNPNMFSFVQPFEHGLHFLRLLGSPPDLVRNTTHPKRHAINKHTWDNKT